jgi:predicted transcriptional regulator
MPSSHGLSQAELKLAEIIWANNPIPTPTLSEITERELGWKKTTTYTFLKRMGDKGVVSRDNATVTAMITRDEFFSGQSRDFVADTFGGSLPMFITSFFGGKKLSAAQASELKRLIDKHQEDDEYE